MRARPCRWPPENWKARARSSEPRAYSGLFSHSVFIPIAPQESERRVIRILYLYDMAGTSAFVVTTSGGNCGRASACLLSPPAILRVYGDTHIRYIRGIYTYYASLLQVLLSTVLFFTVHVQVGGI